MYISFCVVYSLARERNLNWKWFFVVYLAVLVPGFFLYFFLEDLRDVFFIISIVILIANEIRFLVSLYFQSFGERMRRKLGIFGRALFPKSQFFRLWPWGVAGNSFL